MLKKDIFSLFKVKLLSKAEKLLIVNSAADYPIILWNEETRLKNGCFYIRINSNQIEYIIVSKIGEILKGSINKKTLENISNLIEMDASGNLNIKKLESYLPIIINIISQKYQTLAVTDIQRRWQLIQIYRCLNGSYNYDKYNQLLFLSTRYNRDNTNHDIDLTISSIMSGRVQSMPLVSGFPFLKQRNPYVTDNAIYQRTDFNGDKILEIIFNQWQIDTSSDEYMYVPVVDFKFNFLQDALAFLNWQENKDYVIIDPPKYLCSNNHLCHYLKLIRLSRKDDINNKDNTWNLDNRWIKIANLGIVAPARLLAIAVAQGGYRVAAEQYDIKENKTLFMNALNRQSTSIKELKQNECVRKLKRLAQENKEISRLAEGLHSIIQDLPEDLDVPYIVVKLSLFIELFGDLHNEDYVRGVNFFQIIFHEVILLLTNYLEKHGKPLISLQEFEDNVFTEIVHHFKMEKKDIKKHFNVDIFPSISGMHANLMGMLLNANMDTKSKGVEYFEITEGFLSGKFIKESESNTKVVRFSAGPIFSVTAGVIAGKKINDTILEELATNSKVEIFFIDISSASYFKLELEDRVLKALVDRGISLFIWESSSKNNFLHTDTGGAGRLIILSHKLRNYSLIKILKKQAEDIIKIPDIQLAALIQKHFYDYFPQLRVTHFENAKTIREALSKGPDFEDNQFISSAGQYYQNNFIQNFSNQEGEKVVDFFRKLALLREAFGHSKTTLGAIKRIAGGAESKTTIKIFSQALNYFIRYDTKELYTQLINQSDCLDIWQENQLISFLGLVQAFQLCGDMKDFILPFSTIQHLRSIIKEESKLRKEILKCDSKQFISDIYTFFSFSSPFKSILKKLNTNDLFLSHLLNDLDVTYTKTGIINLNSSIKKMLLFFNKKKTIDQDVINQYKKDLFSGFYSREVALFFLIVLKIKPSKYNKHDYLNSDDNKAVFSKKAYHNLLSKDEESLLSKLSKLTMKKFYNIFSLEKVFIINGKTTFNIYISHHLLTDNDVDFLGEIFRHLSEKFTCFDIIIKIHDNINNEMIEITSEEFVNFYFMITNSFTKIINWPSQSTFLFFENLSALNALLKLATIKKEVIFFENIFDLLNNKMISQMFRIDELANTPSKGMRESYLGKHFSLINQYKNTLLYLKNYLPKDQLKITSYETSQEIIIGLALNFGHVLSKLDIFQSIQEKWYLLINEIDQMTPILIKGISLDKIDHFKMLLASYEKQLIKLRFVDNEGNTIFHACCFHEHTKLLEEGICDLGVDINQKNHLGLTALHLAALNKHYDVAKFLLEQGADPTIATPDGKSFLDILPPDIRSDLVTDKEFYRKIRS